MVVEMAEPAPVSAPTADDAGALSFVSISSFTD